VLKIDCVVAIDTNSPCRASDCGDISELYRANETAGDGADVIGRLFNVAVPVPNHTPASSSLPQSGRAARLSIGGIDIDIWARAGGGGGGGGVLYDDCISLQSSRSRRLLIDAVVGHRSNWPPAPATARQPTVVIF